MNIRALRWTQLCHDENTNGQNIDERISPSLARGTAKEFHRRYTSNLRSWPHRVGQIDQDFFSKIFPQSRPVLTRFAEPSSRLNFSSSSLHRHVNCLSSSLHLHPSCNGHETSKNGRIGDRRTPELQPRIRANFKEMSPCVCDSQTQTYHLLLQLLYYPLVMT